MSVRLRRQFRRIQERGRSVFATALLALASGAAEAQSFVTYDNPDAGKSRGLGTNFNAIFESQIVGEYTDSAGINHGYSYDLGTKQYTPLNNNLSDVAGPPYPRGYAQGTTPKGIYGNTIVGYYYGTDHQDHGFIFDGTGYHEITHGSNTDLFCISGNLVGGGTTSAGGFIYHLDTKVFDPFNVPGASNTQIDAILGNQRGGYYDDSLGRPHGYWYDGTTFHTFDYGGGNFAAVKTFYGKYLIGYYADASHHVHSYEYDTLSGVFTNLPDAPGSTDTEFDGVYGDTAVGNWTDTNGVYHAFTYNLAAVPEINSGVALTGLSAFASIGLLWRRRIRSKTNAVSN